MLTVIPYHLGDMLQARKLLSWIKELDSKLNHELLLVASSKVPTEDIVGTNNICSGVFPKVTSVRATIINEGHWPKSANDMFRSAHQWAKRNNKPFYLWLEPDTAPMVPGWLDRIDSEYQKSGKALMGTVYDRPFRHMNGVAVWSTNFPRFNPQILGAQILPFDCVRAESNLKQCHITPLIWRQLADPAKNLSMTFPNQDSLKLIPEGVVLTHCCKDGSIIDRLRERGKVVQEPYEPEPDLDLSFKQSWVERSIKAVKKAGRKAINRNRPIDLSILYICVHGASEPEAPRDWNMCHRRFAETYLKYKPSIPHKVIIVNYNGERTKETDRIFAPLNPVHTYYVGTGFDIGTYQAVGKTLDSELVMFCGSQIHFHRDGWLERLVEAYRTHGEGIYGPMGSYERMPHLRTCCVAMPPKLIRQYPYYINSRADTYRAESGDWNLTRWVVSQGKPALMVTWDGELEVSDWRKPDNIFRRGDQSNCIVWDRHTKVYAEATPQYKQELERSARGIHGVHTFDIICKGKQPDKTVTLVAATSLAPKSHAEAIRRTAACIPFECKKLLMSPVELPDFDGEQLRLPSPWAKNGKWTLEQMADFTLTGLHKYITTDVAIIVHWDGYALNRSRWTDEFLDYDYIGAPWPEHMRFLKRQVNGRVDPRGRVGNGGFSLRSKKWLEAASRLARLPVGVSEDVYTCAIHWKHFIDAGCKLAPPSVAMRWSFEHPIEEFPAWQLSDSFGYHGLIDIDPKRAHLKLSKNA